MLKHDVRRNLRFGVGRASSRFHRQTAVLGGETEDLIFRISNVLRIQGQQGLHHRLTAHQVDELGEDQLNAVGARTNEFGQHIGGDGVGFIRCGHLLQTGEGGLHRVVTLGEITDGLVADQHQLHLEAFARQLSEALFGALDDVGVVAAAKTTVTGDRHQGDGLHVALLHQRRRRILEAHAGLEVFQDPRQPVRERTAAEHLLLSATHLGRSHEAHGLGDLAGVFDRFNPVADFLEIRHVGSSLRPPKRRGWTRLR